MSQVETIPPASERTIIPSAEAFSEATYLNLLNLSGKWWYRFFSYHNRAGYVSGSEFHILVNHSDRNLLIIDLIYAIITAIILTLIRKWASSKLEKAMVKRKLLKEKTFSRFMESFYVCSFSIFSFSWAFMLEYRANYLSQPAKLWQDFDILSPVPRCVWILYLLEVGHYFHSIYAVLRINPWNNEDSIIMLIHHIFALLLLTISYTTKTHWLGVMVITLHDSCDIIMETCRCIIKITPQSVWGKNICEAAKVALFLALMGAWFGLRLYLYPLKVIFPAVVYLNHNQLSLWFPADVALFTLLWLIFIMNVYWAYLLIRILINTLRGGADEIEDIRDVEEMEEKRAKLTKKD